MEVYCLAVYDMIPFHISTNILTHFRHISQIYKEIYESGVKAQTFYDPTRVVVVFLSEKKLLSRTT